MLDGWKIVIGFSIVSFSPRLDKIKVEPGTGYGTGSTNDSNGIGAT